MFNTKGIESLFAGFMLFMVLGLIVAMFIGIADGITWFWQETELEEVVEVVVVDKSMTPSDSGNVRYYVLVKGVASDGTEYCDEHSVTQEEYSRIEPKDILQMEYKRTHKPLFGDRETTNLLIPA